MTTSLNRHSNTQGRGDILHQSLGGIQKLARYITTNFRDWEDKSLAGCPLVLDGNSLPYYLSKRAELEWKYGGQYPALVRIMESFLETLLAENIKPIHIVFDGINPEEKLETVLNRRQRFLDTINKCLNGEFVPPHVEKNILPPLVTEVFRKVVQDYKRRGVVKIYSADGEADCIAVILSNTFNCPLVGEDSDFFIAPLQAGYVPLSNLEWTRPGAPVTAKIYHREAFAASLRISSDLILAIPAIAGNDIITNLVEETSLKYKVRDNPRYRGKDTEGTINLIRTCNTLERLESCLQKLTDGRNVLAKFRANFQKAQEIYENIQPFNEEKFKVSSSIRKIDGRKLPQWLIEQYRDFNFSYRLLEVYVTAQYLFRVIPDDFSQPSAKSFSKPIRQEIYGLIKPEGGNVAEVIRVRDHLAKVDVMPIISEMNIHTINHVSRDERMKKLCQVLLCDPSTFSVIDQEWHIPIASVCFWAKTARIMKNDLRLKSLVLCFSQCYTQDMATLNPAFNITTLHLYTQWQCVYHDAILLNQVLALPLPYLSPAVLFDGKRVTSYSQLKEREFDLLFTRCTRESQELYKKIISIVNANI